MPRVRIKICCISSWEEASLAIEAGADVLGLVSKMPSGPGAISEEEISKIARRVPPGVSTFLLTSETRAAAIAEQLSRCGTSAVQICDRLDPTEAGELRRLQPNVRIVQVVHVEGPGSLDEARGAARRADALLLDSGRPGAAVKELGGTGRRHDWALSAAIAREAPIPVWLAGGLTPDNVAQAVSQVRPFGLDVCTGVRKQGRLDPAKLRCLAQAALG